MEDRCLFFDSTTYGDYSIDKRENLKANSPGSSVFSHESRTSFFLKSFSFTAKKFQDLLQQVHHFVGGSVEIPIFRNLKSLKRQKDGDLKVVSLPPFFNST
jgi:hypothetical protein